MNLSLNFLKNLILITSSFSAKTPENSKGPQREMNHLPTAEWGEHVSCEECNYENFPGRSCLRPSRRSPLWWTAVSLLEHCKCYWGVIWEPNKKVWTKVTHVDMEFLFTSLGKFCCGVFQCCFPQSDPKSRWERSAEEFCLPFVSRLWFRKRALTISRVSALNSWAEILKHRPVVATSCLECFGVLPCTGHQSKLIHFVQQVTWALLEACNHTRHDRMALWFVFVFCLPLCLVSPWKKTPRLRWGTSFFSRVVACQFGPWFRACHLSRRHVQVILRSDLVTDVSIKNYPGVWPMKSAKKSLGSWTVGVFQQKIESFSHDSLTEKSWCRETATHDRQVSGTTATEPAETA